MVWSQGPLLYVGAAIETITGRHSPAFLQMAQLLAAGGDGCWMELCLLPHIAFELRSIWSFKYPKCTNLIPSELIV